MNSFNSNNFLTFKTYQYVTFYLLDYRNKFHVVLKKDTSSKAFQNMWRTTIRTTIFKPPLYHTNLFQYKTTQIISRTRLKYEHETKKYQNV